MAQKIILLSGASGGIGKFLLNQFIATGATIIALYFKHKNFEDHPQIIPYKIDLTNIGEMEELALFLAKNEKIPDVFVHAAGISQSAILEKTSYESWRESFAINVDAPFYLCKTLSSWTKKEGGSIVFLSSVVAQTGVYGTSAYASSKAALFGLTKTLAKEIASKSWNVNTIALGYFDAGMISDVPEKYKAQIIDQIPMKQLGNPDSIAKMIAFLISEEGKYMTGQVINLNGGLY